MRKHRCPWLVALYNAFYEEARVYAAVELMDAEKVPRRFLHVPRRACTRRWSSWMPARSPSWSSSTARRADFATRRSCGAWLSRCCAVSPTCTSSGRCTSSHLSAGPRLCLGWLSAGSQLSLGCLSAVSLRTSAIPRLSLGRCTATSSRQTCCSTRRAPSRSPTLGSRRSSRRRARGFARRRSALSRNVLGMPLPGDGRALLDVCRHHLLHVARASARRGLLVQLRHLVLRPHPPRASQRRLPVLHLRRRDSPRFAEIRRDQRLAHPPRTLPPEAHSTSCSARLRTSPRRRCPPGTSPPRCGTCSAAASTRTRRGARRRRSC